MRMTNHNPQDSAVKLAHLEERMNTRQAENETAFERLEKNLAQRDATNLKWTIGFGIALVAIVLGGMKLLID